MNFTFQVLQYDDQWVTGQTLDGRFTFWAKVYNEGSQYGINEGRVSKLEIADGGKTRVLNYDRGWDLEPAKEYRDAGLLDELLEFLDRTPRYDTE